MPPAAREPPGDKLARRAHSTSSGRRPLRDRGFMRESRARTNPSLERADRSGACRFGRVYSSMFIEQRQLMSWPARDSSSIQHPAFIKLVQVRDLDAACKRSFLHAVHCFPVGAIEPASRANTRARLRPRPLIMRLFDSAGETRTSQRLAVTRSTWPGRQRASKTLMSRVRASALRLCSRRRPK